MKKCYAIRLKSNRSMENKPVTFTISGNPVPYLRMTQGQTKLMRIPDNRISPAGLKIKERIRRYLTWKDWVYANAVKAMPYYDNSPKNKVYLDIMIYFESKVHGDADNIWKGIADAMFKSDKNVVGSFDFEFSKDNPRIEVKLT